MESRYSIGTNMQDTNACVSKIYGDEAVAHLTPWMLISSRKTQNRFQSRPTFGYVLPHRGAVFRFSVLEIPEKFTNF